MNEPRYDKRTRRYEYECSHQGCPFATSSPANRQQEIQLVIDFHNSHVHRPRKTRTKP